MPLPSAARLVTCKCEAAAPWMEFPLWKPANVSTSECDHDHTPQKWWSNPMPDGCFQDGGLISCAAATDPHTIEQGGL